MTLHNWCDPTVSDLRTISLNTVYFCWMASPRCFNSLKTFSIQILADKFRTLLEAYSHCQNKKYYPLIINLHPQTPPEARLMANIFDHPLEIFVPANKR